MTITPPCPDCRRPYGPRSCEPDPGTLPYGDPGEGWAALDLDPPEQCPDCAVSLGGTHHAYCDTAVCSTCGAQALGHICR